MPNRPLASLRLRNIDPPNRFGLLSLLPQAFLDSQQKRSFAFGRSRPPLNPHPSNSRRTAVTLDRSPSRCQRLPPAHPPLQTVEAKPLPVLGFLSQLRSQFPEARRPKRFPKGKRSLHVGCRRNGFPFNQLRVPLTRHDLDPGSLTPSRRDREIHATMRPSDAAIGPRQQLWLPAGSCRLPPNRASQVPDRFFLRALSPLTPGSSICVPGRDFQIDAGFTLLGRLATPILRSNEAEPSSRDAPARAFTFPSLNRQDRSLPLKGRLHDFRPIIMTNTFQFIRTSELSFLALSRKQRRTQAALVRCDLELLALTTKGRIVFLRLSEPPHIVLLCAFAVIPPLPRKCW